MAEPTLKKGSQGQAVTDLQEALETLGFSVGAVDGVFGAATERAVREFQSSVGIDVDGIVGPVTWLNINEADQSEPVLRRGAKGLPVRRLQHRMSLAGLDTGGVDGRFGAQTEQAVRRLQQQGRIAVDGVVGPDTWAIVNALGD